MSKLRGVLVPVAVAACFLAIGSAHASTITFGSPTGHLAQSQAYGVITAYGYTAALTGGSAGTLVGHDLFGKSDGGDETGLGLARTQDNEINAPAGSEAIVLDVRALVGQDLKIGFGSVQRSEGWRVGFSSSLSRPTNESEFSNYVSGTTNYPNQTDLGIDNASYLIVESTSGNILLTSLSYVPEPGSVTVLGFGLLGLGMLSTNRKLTALRVKAASA